jgi:hypothetical protein
MRGFAMLLHVCRHIDVYGMGGSTEWLSWYWDKYPGFQVTPKVTSRVHHHPCVRHSLPIDGSQVCERSLGGHYTTLYGHTSWCWRFAIASAL